MLTSLTLTAVALAVQVAGPVPHYRLAVRVNPDSHTIAVRGRLEGRPCDAAHPLYLNRTFRLESFNVAGLNTPVSFDTAAAPAQWTEVTRPLAFECRPGPVEFSYSGTIADTVAGVNLIAHDLVELALYVGWYPFDPAVPAFTYDVDLDLPAGWQVATGGRTAAAPAARGRQHIRFTSASPGMDLAFMASPGLVVQRGGPRTAPVEVYSAPADTALAVSASRNLQRAVSLYGTWYGQVRAPGEPLPTRMVISPRGGWGYSRLPLILVPAGVMRVWARRPLGEAQILQGTAHELAHFWWQIADANTLADWINEGFAEYSAFSAVRDLYGPAVGDSLTAGYLKSLARAKTVAPIAGTPNDSPDRYLNHYQKPALLFASVESAVGADRLRRFLGDFYAAHAGARDATTDAFLAAARTGLGPEVTARVERCLTQPWTEDCGR